MGPEPYYVNYEDQNDEDQNDEDQNDEDHDDLECDVAVIHAVCNGRLGC